ncbi:hypothetical protein SAMN04244570_2190 [Sporosarcina newyorkensis]|uniref:Uncharacterized protein n=1 Tax=Sporosarcina newyorkensis TaxID=759851 RepID=A0A1T4YAI6_9BACL|nr:hypothetical protein SAMN04244570_2190 [Sporosarcina newyorkensis]
MLSILVGLIIWASILLSPIALLVLIFKRTWTTVIACLIIMLPVSLYCLAGNPPISYIGFAPIVLLISAPIFIKKKKLTSSV